MCILGLWIREIIRRLIIANDESVCKHAVMQLPMSCTSDAMGIGYADAYA